MKDFRQLTSDPLLGYFVMFSYKSTFSVVYVATICDGMQYAYNSSCDEAPGTKIILSFFMRCSVFYNFLKFLNFLKLL